MCKYLFTYIDSMVWIPLTISIRIYINWSSLLKFLFVCVGADLAKQNSITQQILTQYLQKRLARAGGNIQSAGQHQLVGNDLLINSGGGGNGVQKNVAENLYAIEEDDLIGDTQYYQG